MRTTPPKSALIANSGGIGLLFTRDVLRTIIIFIVGLLFISLRSSYAQKKRVEVPKARNARHIVMPFLGYQTYSGEELSASFDLTQTSRFFPGTIFSWRREFTGQQDIRTPAVGLLYRYRLLPNWGIEATAGVLHSKKTFLYSTNLNVFDFTQRFTMTVAHGNTTFGTVYGCYLPPEPAPWISLSFKGGGGFAWRSITTSQGGESFQAGTYTRIVYSTDDAKQMALATLGIDATLWGGEVLLMKIGVHYVQFFPVGSKGSPFGGIGWSVGFFPMWGGQTPFYVISTRS